MECSATAFITSAHVLVVCYISLCLFALGSCTYNCPEDEEVDNTSQVLTSDGFPNRMYKKNQDCEWRLTSKNTNKKIKIEMEVMDIEYDDMCQFDYIEIFDGYDDDSPSYGKYCGTDTFTIVGTGIHLYFHFHTDQEINEKGFKMKYWTVAFRSISSTYPPPKGMDKKDKPKDTSKTDESLGGAKLSTLVGGVLGGLCLLVVIIAVCCMCSSRICRRCSLRNNGRQRPSVSPQSSVVEMRRRDRTRRPSPPHVSPYIPRRPNNHSHNWSPDQNFPMVPIEPPPYRETDNQPVYLVQGIPGYNSHFPPSSPPPTYSSGLSSDSNPPAYEDDRHSPPNYVPVEENRLRY